MAFHPLPLHIIREPLSNDYQPLFYGYVDETGDTSPHSTQPLVIIAVLTEYPRKLELLSRRLYKATGIRIKNREIKAAHLESIYINKLLHDLINLPVFIYAVEIDKKSIRKPPRNHEEIYSNVMCQLFRNCLIEHPRIEWHLDKRYNNQNKQLWLERYIRDELVDYSKMSYTILQEDSALCKPLQIADVVAWSFGQHKKGINQYWKLIEGVISKYEVLEIEKWK